MSLAWLKKKELSSQYLDISTDRFQYEVTSNLNTHSQAKVLWRKYDRTNKLFTRSFVILYSSFASLGIN